MPEKLIIFDYSGTLSLEAPCFARPQSLQRALTESGLADYGVATAEIFWGEIVNPTWVEGSTTPAGYKRVMAERIVALRLAPGTSTKEIETAAAHFVESYLNHSRIDPHWRSIIASLSGLSEVDVIIATDHYAEATAMIINNLRGWGIPAGGIETASRIAPPHPRRVFIANSADLGAWKEEVRFWKVVRDHLAPNRITKLLVIDDFGFNEEAGDRYGGEQEKIADRRERTGASLREVFQADTEIIPFFLEGDGGCRDGALTHLIAEIALRIERFLESP